MGKLFKIPGPAKNKRYAVFFISDLHSYHLHRPTFEIFKKHIELVKDPDTTRIVVLGGDILDAAFLMSGKRNSDYSKYLKSASGLEDYFVPHAKEEIAICNPIIDEVQAVSDEVFFLEGNHDWRYRNFMMTDCPQEYRYNFNLQEQLHLAKRGISYLLYNDWLDLGGDNGISLTHGMYHGATALKRHSEACGGRNVLFGHLHRAESKAFMRRGETTTAWINPCMSDLNPEYIKNNETNWSTGYTSFFMRDDGHLNLTQHQVINNRLVLSCGTELYG